MFVNVSQQIFAEESFFCHDSLENWVYVVEAAYLDMFFEDQ